MKHLYLLLFFYCWQFCGAQTSEINRTNHWYFGEGIGLDFSSGTPVLDTSSPMSQREACAVMSDTAGNLLFYTDGDTVWNKNHTMLTNGFGVGCESSTNGAVIVPKPGNDALYYLFTVDCWENSGSHGLRYTLVDVTANNDSGGLFEKNVQLYSPSSEQLSVTRHCNGIDYWVVAHAYSANMFYAYLITSNGIDTAPVISYHGGDTLPVSKPIGNSGSMCISPNGEKLCFVSSWLGTKLFDFDPSTGQITNMITLTETRYEYGCAFSPDNTKLYVSFVGFPNPVGRYISQYDLSSYDSLLIAASKTTIYWVSYAHTELVGLQLNRNGYIQVSYYYRDSIGIITNPNAKDTLCNYQTFPITFNGRICKEQFPNINTNYYNPSSYICSSGVAEAGQDAIWYFPNPVTDKLHISNLKSQFNAMCIYDVNGRHVLFRQLDYDDNAEVDIGFTPPGIYVLQLFKPGSYQAKSIKFIKH